MKSNNMFKEQVNFVSKWFKNWSECEQTVALYSLLKRTTPTQAKFLAQVLEQGTSAETRRLEEEANDPVFISQLCGESKEKAVSQLLSHLPLLRSGNAQAKTKYLQIIPKILSHSIENEVHIEESRQLLSFSLIHPAITSEERSQFTMWLSYLEERYTYNIHHHSQQNNFGNQSGCYQTENYLMPGANNQHLPASGGHLNGWNRCLIASTTKQNLGATRNVPVLNSYSRQGGSVTDNNVNSDRQVAYSSNKHVPLHATTSAPPNYTFVPMCGSNRRSQPNTHAPLRRTSSATPPLSIPTNNISQWLGYSKNVFSVDHCQSSASDHVLLSPQSSVTSSGSGSDTHHDDHNRPLPGRNTFLEKDSNMGDVPVWLKTLRLHKYTYLFQKITYDEMLNITEKWLEAQNVTKGARHKILMCIEKLRNRQSLLRWLEKDIMNGGSIRYALAEMKVILNSPMKAFNNSTYKSNDDIRKAGTETLPSSPTVCEGEGSTVAEGDIPGQFTRLMGKACTQILVTKYLDNMCCTIYLHLIDKCINHMAFSQKHRKLLTSWRQQVQKIWYSTKNKYDYDNRPRHSWGNTFPISTGYYNNQGSWQRGNRFQQKENMLQWSFGSKRSSAGRTGFENIPLHRKSSFNTGYFPRPRVIEPPSKQTVTRTQSAPMRCSQIGMPLPPRPASDLNMTTTTDVEINARLDSLCRSMTEIALGGGSGGGTVDATYKGSTF